MKPTVSSFLIGILFGVGLAVSQMINPAKVMGFLDVAGNWDPTLLLVMVTALAVSGLGYSVMRVREKPLLEASFRLPNKYDLDFRLITGAAIFGVGWGLSGFCPGPAISALGTGLYSVFVFVAAMIAGMWLQRRALPE